VFFSPNQCGPEARTLGVEEEVVNMAYTEKMFQGISPSVLFNEGLARCRNYGMLRENNST
jgi:hypothetical protein